ncbi:MauE/DoxX family redox-associated membrane protein [Hyphococcus sp.]|jgi:glutaredoxin|uniref:MauE/DoxX family redox-associated membrane protein n=1 Tax=Hyphococcus sp. TaxID=2038636 RepID=UPI003D0CB94F
MADTNTRTGSGEKHAKLYRMVTPEHICPFGLKSKALLERKGYTVEDFHLRSRESTDQFKAEHNVKTTPQTFINGDRIGGYDALKKYFGLDVADPDEKTYAPVIAIFAMAFLMAAAARIALSESVFDVRTLEWFIAFAMCLLAVQKLRDLRAFSNQFLGYDLLAQRVVPYAYVYPFAEALAGVLMIAGAMIWLASPVAIFIGSVGAVSVFKAVYVDKRELKCACVGGNSNVPLGFVSLTENLMMIAMGVWMLAK